MKEIILSGWIDIRGIKLMLIGSINIMQQIISRAIAQQTI